MPKIVDHAERRRAIADAFRRVLGERGSAAATFARVAEEAGVSVGTIQHYFADRADLLVSAHRYDGEAMLARVDARVVIGEAEHEPIAAMVMAGLEELLPLDEARRLEGVVRLHLTAAATHDAALAELAQEVAAGWEERLRQAVLNGVECGEVASGVDAEVAARRLVATAYGLATGMVLTGGDASASTDVHAPVVATVFTGRCRHHDDPEPG